MIRVRAPWLSGAMILALAAIMATAATAAAAAGPAIPGGAYGEAGVTGPSGTAAAEFRYVIGFGGARGSTLAKVETDGGEVPQWRFLDDSWALPAVTLRGEAGGLSADGQTLTLIQPAYGFRARETKLMFLDTRRLKIRERLTLEGRFSFDAISPDGRLVYLVEYEDPRDPLDYRVRAYDLATGEFLPGEVVDPEEPDEQMSGQPLARQTSPDGRWAYTLYAGGEETFIHALDTVNATAACIDLPQLEGRNIFDFDLEVDPRSGALTALKRGEPVAVVDPDNFEVSPAPTEDVAEETGGGAESDESGWVAWALGGVGALLALVAVGLARQRRRGRETEQALEDLLGVDGESLREEDSREREPVR